jgi:ADP-ribosylglycohydrolase
MLLTDPELFRDKARGALIGLAIGDSFGDASRNQNNQMAYGFTADFNKGASWSTDDTEFALLTAKTLIDCKGKLTSQNVVDAWLTHVSTQDELKRGGASEY